MRVNGRLDQLPFDQGEGVLEVRLPVTQARLEYHPGWSAVTDLDAFLAHASLEAGEAQAVGDDRPGAPAP